jgi:transcriptional regulator with XRE-family HTH domain
MPKRRSAEEAAAFKGMGLAVIELCESRGLSKADLASKAEVAASALRQIERGEVDAKWGTLRKLASALQIPLDALIEMALELAPGVGRQARRESPDHSA